MGFLYTVAALIQAIGIIVPLIGCFTLYQKEQNKASTSLMLTNIGCLVVNGAYLLLFWADSYDEAFSALRFQYLGYVFFYLSFMQFICAYMKVGDGKIHTILLSIWGFVESMLVIFLWMEDPFHLVYKSLNFNWEDRGFTLIELEPGILYILHNGMLCTYFLIGLIYAICKMFRVKQKEEQQNIAKVVGSLFVVVTAIIVMVVFELRYDILPVFAALSILSIILGVIKGDFFKVTDLGREWVVEHSDNALVIVDDQYGYLDSNLSAKKVFPALESVDKGEILPKRIKEIFFDGDEHVVYEGRHYRVEVGPIGRKNEVLGYSLILIDITEQCELLHQIEQEKEKAESANEAKSAFMSTMSHEIRTPMNAIVGMTDILLREEMPSQTREYLNNIKSSGSALLTIINDILDFSKIEAGKMEIIKDEYEPMSGLHDMSMIFLNRIGNKDVELIYDIDPQLPEKLYGDAQRIRQVVINLMNNAIKFTESGYVKLTVQTEPIDEENINVSYYIEDTGQGIRQEDIGKLFGNYQQVDTKKNHHKEGTGLGLSISKQLVELMGGTIGVSSEYGKGSTFYFTLPQKVCSVKKAASIKPERIEKTLVCGKFKNPLITEQYNQLVNHYQIQTIDPETYAQQGEKVTIFFLDEEGALTNEDKLALEKWGPKVCVLQNPMKNNHSGLPVALVNKPLYSLNFCQIINGEAIAVEREEEILCFIAPDAKILFVDDHEMNLKVAKGLVAPLQVQVDTAENGKQAIEKIKKNYYDMVFMDHMMPVMDGIEAIQEIRKLEGEYFQELPIIALSANATTEARELFRANGFYDFIPKPIKMKELCGCIRRWLPLGTVIYDPPKNEPAHGEPKKEQLQIDGLDVAEGIANSGSKELFLSLLGDFYKLIDKKATKVEKLLADGMLRDYTIEVHALKSTARMIGAMELSEKFYELERLGNAEEQKILENKTPAVLSLYRSYKPILAPYGRVNEDKQTVPVEDMITDLEQLKTAMDSFDLDGADEAMRRLEGYAFPENCQSMVEDLSAFVADVAMEDVMKLTDQLIDELHK